MCSLVAAMSPASPIARDLERGGRGLLSLEKNILDATLAR